MDIDVVPGIMPKFYKARSVPFVLKDKIENELDRLLQQGVISPVKTSEWATPIVPVVKKCGSIRICGDYKLTANIASTTDVYPLPKIEELFTDLAGGKTFTKLDLSHAYLQLPLGDVTRPLTTINTHKGLFQYTRMPFGISSAPAVFQRTMDNLFKGLPHVTTYIDDIVVTGATDEEHLRNLDNVLDRLREAGVRLKKEKCIFQANQVEYLGHLINAEGLHPSPSKVKAVIDAPTPTNLTELRSFIGLVNYYRKFIPNLSTELSALYLLLQKDKAWSWGVKEDLCFNKAKTILTSPTLLVHFNPEKQLVLSCDASPYGIGAVLAHQLDADSQKPICYASRTLSPAEKKYSQLDKEALAIVFGVTKFHQYLYGRCFTLLTDHKPLTSLFNPSRSVPQMASARIQQWALTLGTYNYKIHYRKGKDHGNADCLSRLPLQNFPEVVPVPGDILLTASELVKSPVSARNIRNWTSKDPLLSSVLRFITTGWPNHIVQPKILPYFSKRAELSVEDGCIFRGSRIVIPPPGRQLILQELHNSHPGMSRMKSLARGYLWWPGLDADLESVVRECSVCQLHRNKPPLAPVYPWQWPDRPWQRIHIDFAGPFLGRLFLVIVDAHSKWIELHSMSSSNSISTIEKLRQTFSIFGLPKTLVSDNGSSFTSQEFQTFMSENGINHIRVAPYHPASNGLAERAVQALKEGLRKLPAGSIETRLYRFLFAYRTTPQSSTGTSPAHLMFGRPLRTRLDLLFPDPAQKMDKVVSRMMDSRGARNARSFKPNDLVYCRDFSSGKEKWIEAQVQARHGPLSYSVTLPEGRLIKRHVDHLMARTTPASVVVTADETEDTSDEDIFIYPSLPSSPTPPLLEQEPDSSSNTVRRSTRSRRSPDRYDPCRQ